MVWNAFYTALTEDNAITAIVGTRVYAQVMPQNGAFPCIVLNVVTSTPVNAFGGHIGTEESRVQVDLLHTTLTGVRTLAAAARDALNGMSDSDGTPSISTCYLISEQSDNESPEPDSENIVRRVIQEYSVWHDAGA